MLDNEGLPEGIIFKKRDNQPDFVIGSIAIKKADFIAWLNNQPDDWVNLQALISKAGKPYLKLDTWKPTPQAEQQPAPPITDDLEDKLPF